MLRFLLQCLTWWNGQTIAGRIWTYCTGQSVGADSLGNRYYQNRRGRRWVIYAGVAEASKVPPLWHSWLHHMCDVPPQSPTPENWLPNMTGTPLATRPSGSLAGKGQRHPATGDYQAWQPPAATKSKPKKRSRPHAQQHS